MRCSKTDSGTYMSAWSPYCWRLSRRGKHKTVALADYGLHCIGRLKTTAIASLISTIAFCPSPAPPVFNALFYTASFHAQPPSPDSSISIPNPHFLVYRNPIAHVRQRHCRSRASPPSTQPTVTAFAHLLRCFCCCCGQPWRLSFPRP